MTQCLRMIAPIAALVLTAFSTAQLPPKVESLPKGKVEVQQLLDMKTERDAEMKNGVRWGALLPMLERQWKALDELLAADKLATGADFYVASELAGEPMGAFARQQVVHEFAVTSLILDEPNAPRRVAQSWDQLMVSMGRQPRLGMALSYDFATDGPKAAELDPAASPAIGAILRNPEEARKKVEGVQDSSVLQEIRAADQKDRQGDPGKPKSREESLAWMKRDEERRDKVLELLKAGEAKTGKDYEAAALVLQHGGHFGYYQAGHECSLAAVTLGYKEAAWLISRSYDRMLLSAGYEQRYATNLDHTGLPAFKPGVSDFMRKVAKASPLADQVKRAAEWRQQVAKMSGGG